MSRYQMVTTRFGTAALGFDPDPFRLLEIKLPTDDLDALCQPMAERGWQLDHSDPSALAVADRLINYFNGEPIRTPWQIMDLSPFTRSQQSVYRTVAAIPYGRTASYGEVARRAGLPRAARFVGTTMANNRYPVLIPCHRVIKSNGSPGLFGGGEALKVRMLQLEADSPKSFSSLTNRSDPRFGKFSRYQ
jgi:methylated-DNA-[protein]-cysteine S-methyltransferase